ncbi:Tyrosine phosphatase family protein [Reticulomyxa filosa]|uniref:Tyrosine phosphatase family protein n=1 Tax=Reticulomyxa filosa TaxID=46433 RepID=X6LXN7_RETFI|nr:Tyrosine phosphatase family protein [Reticulomyxa filosa]|eukprot:ETO05887.1 Tyrosine phosphatase family protein [Reticulomyxa filosa]
MESIYRGAYPTLVNFTFLKRLHLKSMISIIPETVTRDLQSFCKDNNIRNYVFKVKQYDEAQLHLTYEIVSQVLSLLMNSDNLPAYLHCLDGAHYTGLIIACLRRLQHWNFHTCIWPEYLSYISEIDNGEVEMHETWCQRYQGCVTFPWNLQNVPSWFFPSWIRSEQAKLRHQSSSSSSSSSSSFSSSSFDAEKNHGSVASTTTTTTTAVADIQYTYQLPIHPTITLSKQDPPKFSPPLISYNATLDEHEPPLKLADLSSSTPIPILASALTSKLKDSTHSQYYALATPKPSLMQTSTLALTPTPTPTSTPLPTPTTTPTSTSTSMSILTHIAHSQMCTPNPSCNTTAKPDGVSKPSSHTPFRMSKIHLFVNNKDNIETDADFFQVVLLLLLLLL